MTDPVQASTSLPTDTTPSDGAGSVGTATWPGAAPFDGRLRLAALATSRSTVSLDQMVRTATSATAPTAGTSPTRSIGLGAMTSAATTATTATVASTPLTAGSASSGQARVATVTNFALAQQGKPYVFATTGPNSYDCSGLVTASYRRIGVEMPAYSFTQATYGRAVDPSQEAIKPGDLIFVRGGRPAKDLGHVGIAISATEWIQAPHTGDVVKVGPLPYGRIQKVRRIVES
jgi:cell wall-associated NlpC family hydrolase